MQRHDLVFDPSRSVPSSVRHPGGLRSWLDRLSTRAFEPVDGASLGVFRGVFGWLMFVEAMRYFGSGWIRSYYIDPQFHFTYLWFSWVKPWPSVGMYLHFAALALASIGIMLGYAYRLSVAAFLVGFAYVFLLEKAHYLNHFYVILLIAWLLLLVPAHRCFAVKSIRPESVRGTHQVPVGALWLVQGQLILIYVYAAIAKLNVDWLRGEPLTTWLQQLAGLPIVGSLLATDEMGLFLSYGGLILDGVVAPLLLFKRTRWIAALLLVSFHLTNAFLFDIGIFPWMMIGTLALFFPPDWPRRVPQVVSDWASRGRRAPRWLARQFEDLARATRLEVVHEASHAPALDRRPARTLMLAWGVYFILQLVIPLRHHLYPGDVAWTDEGHRFSWRMKLRDRSGHARFFVQHPEEEPREISLQDLLTERQIWSMHCTPDMLLEFSHYVAEQHTQGGVRPAVFVQAECSLHDRPLRPLVDPRVDLGREEWSLRPAAWIMPGP